MEDQKGCDCVCVLGGWGVGGSGIGLFFLLKIQVIFSLFRCDIREQSFSFRGLQ